MTWITDDNGTKWHDVPMPKQRKSPRALRFADLKVGDQIMLKPHANWYRKISSYLVVTDLWFDPVLGQDDPVKGSMVGYRQIGPDGEPRGRKTSTTIRGLASQQYEYADIDYIAQAKITAAALQSGDVVGIGYGKTIRKRPKIAGSIL